MRGMSIAGLIDRNFAWSELGVPLWVKSVVSISGIASFQSTLSTITLIPSGEWRRYVHTVQHYTEEEFRAMVTRPGQEDDYDFPPCWTPEEWNSLSEECRLILERPVQDAAWCHCSDSRDQDNIGDNPVV